MVVPAPVRLRLHDATEAVVDVAHERRELFVDRLARDRPHAVVTLVSGNELRQTSRRRGRVASLGVPAGLTRDDEVHCSPFAGREVVRIRPRLTLSSRRTRAGTGGVVPATAERHLLDEIVSFLLGQSREDLVADAHHELGQGAGADSLASLGQEAVHVAGNVVGHLHGAARPGRRADTHLEQLLPQIARRGRVAVERAHRTVAEVDVRVIEMGGGSPNYAPAELVEQRHNAVEVAHLLGRLAGCRVEVERTLTVVP